MISNFPMNSVERRMIFIVSILYMVRMLGLFMVIPVLGLFSLEIQDSTPFLIGLALGGYGLTQAIFQIPMGWLSDIFGRKPVILAGLSAFALGSYVAGVASDVYMIIVGRVLQGVGAIAGSVMALIIDNTREAQRAKAMAIVGSSIGLSFSFAMVLGPAVASVWGVSGIFFLTACLSILAIGLVIYGIPNSSESKKDIQINWHEKSYLITQVCKDVNLRHLYFGIFCLHFTLVAVFSFVPYTLENLFNWSRLVHWQLYLPIILTSIFGVLLILKFSKNKNSSDEFQIIFTLFLLLSVLVLLYTEVFYFYCFFLLLFFVVFNYLEAILPALVGRFADVKTRGTALGVFSTSQFFGTFLGGVFGGWLFKFDSSVWAFFTVPLLVWISWKLQLTLLERGK